MNPSPTDWRPDSWRSRPVSQLPTYPDSGEVDRVMRVMSQRPPLVTSWEVDRLRRQLAEASAGRRFVLQGGDCAERFDECRPDVITSRLKILLQMSLVLIHGLRLPIVRVGRLAGQYAKPRSADTEIIGGVELSSYRGDIINGAEAERTARVPNPERMLEAYGYSALTLNFVRALVDGGFADLHHPEYWDLGFVQQEGLKKEYQHIVDAIIHVLRFMDSVSETPPGELERVDFYTSHEALLLPYEQALTRRVPHQEGWYDLSTHFPWIGLRTSDPEGAHVEYARGIANPIGLKVGASTSFDTLRSLLRVLDPENQPGRLTLVTRFGAGAIGDYLPAMIETVRAEGKSVLWCCDPMHGNTETTDSGIKTRHFDTILSELEQAFDIHAASGSHLGGVHFELTGDNVTECLGGASGLSESDLGRDYKSHVDPRLNGEQALEMAFSIVRKQAGD